MRFRVAASAASHTYATALGLSFTSGKDVFGTVGIGRTRDGELDASSFDLSLAGGADIAAGRERRVFLCPLAAFSVSFGPYDFLLSQVDYFTFEGALGVGAAAVAVRSHRLTVLPAGGLRVARETVTYTPSARAREDGAMGRSRQSDIYGLLELGVGLVVNEVLTIRPGVTVPFDFVAPGATYPFAVPFGQEEREVSLGISVGVNFGRRIRTSDAGRQP